MENLVQIIIWWAVIWFTLKFLGNALLTFINKYKRKSFTDNVKKPIPKEIKLGMLAPLLVIIVWVVLYYNSSL